jgi:hypothetical protein
MRKTSLVRSLALAALLLPAANMALAAMNTDPDWPCIQRKVPELSIASLWQGPPADDALLRAVAAGGGEVLAVSDEDFPDSARPVGGLGALLRWTHETAARGGGVPPGTSGPPES